MAENKYVGSLILRTIDIDPTKTRLFAAGVGYDNEYGTTNANGCYVLWKNINIRSCMGELYHKYKKFNLKMTCAQIRHIPGTGTATADAQFLVYISGLPFPSGSTYNTRIGPSNQAVLGCVNFVCSNVAGTTTPITAGLVTFDKPLQDITNISIELKNSSTTTINGYREKTITTLGHYSILCDIYGVEEF